MEPIGSANGFMYYGDREGWLIAASQHYDSSTVTRSNFRVMARELGVDSATADPYGGPDGENADNTAAVENYGGAWGRGQFLLVRPGSLAELQARAIRARMDDYPVLDDDDLSDLEADESIDNIAEALRSRRHANHSAYDSEVNRRDIAAMFYSGHPCPEFYDRWPRFTGQDDDPRDRAILAAAVRLWRAWKRRRVVA